jgi:hypothetical protein
MHLYSVIRTDKNGKVTFVKNLREPLGYTNPGPMSLIDANFTVMEMSKMFPSEKYSKVSLKPLTAKGAKNDPNPTPSH